MPKQILTEEQADWVVTEYQAGRTNASIAKDLYVGENTVRRILVNRGIPRRQKKGNKIHRPTDPKQNAFIVAMYERGWSMRELAEMLDLSVSTIQNRMKIMGVKRRKNSDAQVRRNQRRLESAEKR
jgi:DNA-binding NarL/FixJ family response regulator